jgi:HSP20 family protein
MTLLNVFKPSALSSKSGSCGGSEEAGLTYVRPRYEIDENEDAFRVDVDLPGVSKSDLSVTLHDGLLEVVGKRNDLTPKGWRPLGHAARDSYAYRLRLMVGDRVEEGKIAADCKNGVLRLTLPKEEEKKPRKISIN